MDFRAKLRNSSILIQASSRNSIADRALVLAGRFSAIAIRLYLASVTGASSARTLIATEKIDSACS